MQLSVVLKISNPVAGSAMALRSAVVSRGGSNPLFVLCTSNSADGWGVVPPMTVWAGSRVAIREVKRQRARRWRRVIFIGKDFNFMAVGGNIILSEIKTRSLFANPLCIFLNQTQTIYASSVSGLQDPLNPNTDLCQIRL
jgi:hypothetical protein